MTSRPSGLRLAAAIAVLLLALSSLARGQQVEQSRLEAAMSLQLLSFTEWPQKSDSDPIRIGVFNSPQSLAAFQSLLENPNYSERYSVCMVTSDTGVEELSRLDALFFDELDPLDIHRMLRRVQGMPVVLLGSFDGFLEIGGMVNFVKRKRRLGFEIDLDRSRASGIEFRAKLLRLADRIIEE